MDSLEFLNVAIGITFFYLLLSLVCTVVNEAIASWLSRRAKQLEEGIRNIFAGSKLADGTNLVDAFYSHPLIRALYKDGGSKPSYIPARTFTHALIDIFVPAKESDSSGTKQENQVTRANLLRNRLAAAPASPARDAVLALLSAAGNDLEKTRKNIEEWYDDAMDRVAGWYKRKSQTTIVLLAIIVVIFTNADSVEVSKRLLSDSAIRTSFAVAAQKYVESDTVQRGSTGTKSSAVLNVDLSTGPSLAKANQSSQTQAEKAQSSTSSPQEDITRLQRQLKEITNQTDILNLPMGWNQCYCALTNKAGQALAVCAPSGVPSKILGLLLTIIALSLGSPFWFDLLNKIMVLRATVKPKEKSPEKESK